MSTTVSTVTIIAALVALMGVQTFWIKQSLDALSSRLDAIERRLDRLEQRLDDMFRVLLEHGERITKLEERL